MAGFISLTFFSLPVGHRFLLFTDEIREQRLNEIVQKRDELEQFAEERFGPRGDYFTHQKELPEPIQRLIFDALTPVASHKNFDFVFDRSEDTRFLYTRQEWNLTAEVMLKLVIDGAGN